MHRQLPQAGRGLLLQRGRRDREQCLLLLLPRMPIFWRASAPKISSENRILLIFSRFQNSSKSYFFSKLSAFYIFSSKKICIGVDGGGSQTHHNYRMVCDHLAGCQPAAFCDAQPDPVCDHRPTRIRLRKVRLGSFDCRPRFAG